MFTYIGVHVQDTFTSLVSHGVAGGISNELQGGKFANGFVSQMFSKGATIYARGMKGLDDFGRGVVAITAGGVVAELGGGKFKNGATTAAMGYLFNELNSPVKQRSKVTTKIRASASLSMEGGEINRPDIDEAIEYIKIDKCCVLDSVNVERESSDLRAYSPSVSSEGGVSHNIGKDVTITTTYTYKPGATCSVGTTCTGTPAGSESNQTFRRQNKIFDFLGGFK